MAKPPIIYEQDGKRCINVKRRGTDEFSRPTLQVYDVEGKKRKLLLKDICLGDLPNATYGESDRGNNPDLPGYWHTANDDDWEEPVSPIKADLYLVEVE